MRIGNTFAAGSGVDVISGSPAGIAPEDYGLKSYRLHRIDSVVAAGLAAESLSRMPGVGIAAWTTGI